jgi:hypothetical protein
MRTVWRLERFRERPTRGFSDCLVLEIARNGYPAASDDLP